MLFLPTLLMIVFRQKYPLVVDAEPRAAAAREPVAVYLALMTTFIRRRTSGKPSRWSFPLRDVERDLNRWLPLSMVPRHPATTSCVLFLHRGVRLRGDRLVRDPLHRAYRPGLFDFVLGVMRWGEPRNGLRVPADHGQVPAVRAQRLAGTSSGRAESARRASSSIFPLRGVELRRAQLVRAPPRVPRARSPRESGFTVLETLDDLLELPLRLLERGLFHSTRAPNRPSATSTASSSPVLTACLERTIASPVRTIA